jgi:hypothetical protein
VIEGPVVRVVDVVGVVISTPLAHPARPLTHLIPLGSPFRGPTVFLIRFVLHTLIYCGCKFFNFWYIIIIKEVTMIGYSSIDVSRILGVTRHQVDRLRVTGDVGPLDRVGNTYIYRPTDVVKVASILGVEVPGFRVQGEEK